MFPFFICDKTHKLVFKVYIFVVFSIFAENVSLNGLNVLSSTEQTNHSADLDLETFL